MSKKPDETYVSGERYAENSNIELVSYNRAQYTSNIINDSNQYYRLSDRMIASDDGVNDEIYINREKKRIQERINKKPVEVYQELFEETPKIDTTGIKEKIKLVKKRLEYLTFLGGQTSDEKTALKYLNARDKFDAHGHLFIWPTTTREKINELCSKYTLEDVNFNMYSKTIPMEAIYELEKFINAWNKVTKKGEKPEPHLIIDDGPKSRSDGGERKKDPILYVGSPFGKWYYVLGAWDKEVQYVDEIIYRGK
jgi:hypothetical protein